MTFLNNNGKIIMANLIILILEFFYVEGFYLQDNNYNRNYQKLNNNDFNVKKFKLINDEQSTDESNNYSKDSDSALPFGSRTGYLVVMISSYLAVYLNFVGTSYVLYRSFYRWRGSRRNPLPMTLRVPMYIAITDSFVMITHLVNISHMATSQKPWEDISCKLIGGLSFFFQFMNIFLVGGVAFTTFLRVKRGRCFSLGKYDYKLFIGMLIPSLISTAIFSRNYGANKYWCAADFDDVVLAIYSLCIITFVITASLFCYISIIREMRSIKVDEYFANGDVPEEIANQRKETNKRIYSKISSYILIFIIQYIPVTIYHIGHIMHIENYWVFVVGDIGINFGGIGNFVQYTINEGWNDRPDESSNAYGLNVTNYRYPYAAGRRSTLNSNNSRMMNQDFSEAVDSFGIIRPTTTTTVAAAAAAARQKTNKKLTRPLNAITK